MIRFKDGIRIFEGRFEEIIERHESRAIAAPEGRDVASWAERIELVTEVGNVVVLTADDGGIRIERMDED